MSGDQKAFMYRATIDDPTTLNPANVEGHFLPWYGNKYGGNYVTPQSSTTGSPELFIESFLGSQDVSLLGGSRSLPVGIGLTFGLDVNNGIAKPIKADLIVDATNADSDGFYGLRAASFGFVFNGATFDSARSLPSSTDAQVAAQIGLTGVVGRNYLYNGATWDRAVSQGNSADAVATTTLGIQKQAGFNYGFNGATWDRLVSGGDAADARATGTTGHLATLAHGYAFNGTTFDRLRVASAAVVSAATQQQALLVSQQGDWAVQHNPAVSTQATITKAAGGAGVRHVLTSIYCGVNMFATQNPPSVLVIRNGAAGVGTILWAIQLGGNAVSVQSQARMSGLNIVGSPNTAMTVEFMAAPVATSYQYVNAAGHSTV